MKKLFVLVALAAILASCVQSETLDVVEQVQTKGRSAINFDVYTQRNISTKAGVAGDFTNDSLINGPLHSKDGFGVFTYYTDNGNYDQYCKPNYMYNQQVTVFKTVPASASNPMWKYEPVKYWPNETGAAASSDDMDKLSFFAYAPWVKVVPNTGAIDVSDIIANTDYRQGQKDTLIAIRQGTNITGMTTNSASGDPLIKYVVDWVPSTSVDLLWGVQGTGDNEGKPFTNQTKPGVADSIKFNLKHALAKLNIQIDTYVDGVDATNAVASETKIWVRSITFQGFSTKGALNLNNTTKDKPLWLDYAGANSLETEAVTIHDGRKDGKEGYTGTDGAATNEKLTGLNPVIVQSGKYTIDTSDPSATILVADNPGVTKTAVNLFNPGDAFETADKKLAAPIYVIPTEETLTFTIVYDVETYDKNLAGYLSDGEVTGSTIENKITQSLSTIKLEAGKAYTIKLHLGITNVKVAATVTDWGSATAQDVNLPANN